MNTMATGQIRLGHSCGMKSRSQRHRRFDREIYGIHERGIATKRCEG